MGPVALGHEFETDVVEFRFQPPPDGEMEPVWFSYSLAFAILEGTATVLDVPSSDLNVTVRYEQGEGVSPIILYDNVPGGAGLVAWLEDEKILRSVLEQARERVSLNCCDEQTSCYTCLRSYRNQFAHEHLQRGPVKRYLEKILGQW